MKADPNAKIVIVGYADGEKAPMEGTGKKRHPMNLAAQRAVNAKAYLVQQQGIDPSRVDVRQGTGQQKVADIIWVPQGADENACADLQNTTPVNESVVKPSENAYPKPKKAAPMHHKKAAAAPGSAAITWSFGTQRPVRVILSPAFSFAAKFKIAGDASIMLEAHPRFTGFCDTVESACIPDARAGHGEESREPCDGC